MSGYSDAQWIFLADLDAVPLLVDERALAHHPRYPVVHLVVGPVPLLRKEIRKGIG